MKIKSLEQKMFDEQKGEFLKEGYLEDDLGQCCRCYKVEPFSGLHRKYDESYCECCYDDMFVPWGKHTKALQKKT